MRRVVIETPFKANAKHTEEEHVKYARRCLYDSINRGEAPLASHLLYPQILDDSLFEERQLGIAAGLAWHAVAEAVIVYKDYGISSGMTAAIEAAKNAQIPIEYRSIFSAEAEF